MGRPALTQDELVSTQHRIMKVAARLIASEGYPGLSMRRLAEGVNLTAAALYRYFPTKQHVLNAYWTTAIDELNETFASIDRKETRHGQAILEMLSAYGAFALSDHDRFRLMFLENDLGAMDEFGQRDETFASFVLLTKRVDAAIRAGELREQSVERAAQLLWGAVHGVVTLSITVKELDFGDTQELVRAAAQNALRGLATQRPSKRSK